MAMHSRGTALALGVCGALLCGGLLRVQAQAPVVRSEPSASSSGASALAIHVTDTSGAAVQDAAVQVTPAGGGEAQGPLWTDQNGVVSLPEQPGSYEVRVLAQGFTPSTLTVDMKGPGPQSVTFTLRPPGPGQDADVNAPTAAPTAVASDAASTAIVAPRYFAVHVTDSTGAVVPNAEVRIDLPGREDTEPLHTDKNGFVSVSEPEGHYQLTVNAQSFAPAVRLLDVSNSATEALVIPLVLHVAPVVSPVVVAAPAEPVTYISPTRPIPTGLAPGLKFKLISDGEGANVFALIFSKGDEVLSGLTDFCISHNITDAHFQAIGAVSGATLGWLDLTQKQYRAIPVREQAEVVSMMGDVAEFNGKPVVHAHVVLGKQDGSTVGGHLWEAHVNPTLEVFLTANPHPLEKVPDAESGMKVIDPTKPTVP